MTDILLAFNVFGFSLAWLVMLVWIGVLTLFIDYVGAMFGWWEIDE